MQRLKDEEKRGKFQLSAAVFEDISAFMPWHIVEDTRYGTRHVSTGCIQVVLSTAIFWVPAVPLQGFTAQLLTHISI